MADFVGSILELKGNQAIVITDACDFITIKRQSEMFIGQQIKFRKSDLYSTKKNYMKYFALAASVFVIAFSYVLYYQFFIPSTVFAYIDVDINPSLEFAIDKNAQVLYIKPLNKDAQTLLKDLKLVDLPVKQAIAEVVKESKQQGFIKPDKKNAVLISASIDADKNYKPNESEEKVLDNILTDIGSAAFDLGNEKIKPKALKVTPEYRSLAIKNKISMGRYALYNKIKQEKNINITVEEAKTARVSDMLDKAQINDSNDIKSETKNGDDTQINKNEGTTDNGTDNSNQSTEGDKNGGQSTPVDENNKASENSNQSTEGDKNGGQSTSVDKNNKAGENSNQSTEGDKNGGQSTSVDENNKAGENSNQSTTGDKSGNNVQSTKADPTNKPADSSNIGTSKDKNANTDSSTTVEPTNKQDNANPDGVSNTPTVNQESGDQDISNTAN